MSSNVRWPGSFVIRFNISDVLRIHQLFVLDWKFETLILQQVQSVHKSQHHRCGLYDHRWSPGNGKHSPCLVGGKLKIWLEKVYLTPYLSYMVYFTPKTMKPSVLPLNFPKPFILPPGRFLTVVATVTAGLVQCQWVWISFFLFIFDEFLKNHSK